VDLTASREREQPEKEEIRNPKLEIRNKSKSPNNKIQNKNQIRISKSEIRNKSKSPNKKIQNSSAFQFWI
jgi:hypothetical protein